MDTLSKIMLERAGLGQTGETYLVGTNHAMLTESRSGEEGIYVRTEGASAAIGNHAHGAGVYDGYRGEPVVGVYRWLPELEVALLAEQGQAEAFSSLYTMLVVNAGVVLVAVMLAVAGSLFVTRGIANPLSNLAETATQIAGGDLERVARIEREDEIGAVAQAFNQMTARLRDLIGSLEQRVAERTRDLERRSTYLEASAQVGHAAASILEADQLMRQVVDLIRERFGLYYVGLFLVEGEWAVLRAGTGEAGRIMLARGHRLKVGAGMIGWSIANAQARVALEAGEDAVRRIAAELPETRSEAALPLRSRGRVIGALTVQHVQPGAFDQDTIVVLQTMADQVAVALDNAYLFAEAQAGLEAEHRAYGELSREAWTDLLRARPDLAYRSDEHGITDASDIRRPEMEQALREGRTIQIPNPKSQIPNSLAVPIKVRGHVIGVLDTHKPGDAGEWTPAEIALLETLTGRLGEALESARLFQDTQRRAARERLVGEITTRVRASMDTQAQSMTAGNRDHPGEGPAREGEE
jgi:GAF domain-containing protein